jgi:hypothetical protein
MRAFADDFQPEFLSMGLLEEYKIWEGQPCNLTSAGGWLFGWGGVLFCDVAFWAE